MPDSTPAIQFDAFAKVLSTFAADDDVRLKEYGPPEIATGWSRYAVSFCDFFRSSGSIAHQKSLAMTAYLDAVRAEYGELMLTAVTPIAHNATAGASATTLTARKIVEVNKYLAGHGGQHWKTNDTIIRKAAFVEPMSLADSILFDKTNTPSRNEIFEQCINGLKAEATGLGITNDEFQLFANFYQSDSHEFSEATPYAEHHKALSTSIETALGEYAQKKGTENSNPRYELSPTDIHTAASAVIEETLKQNL